MSAAAKTLIIPIYDLFSYYFAPLSPSTANPSHISANLAYSTTLSIFSPTTLYLLPITLYHPTILSAFSTQMLLMPGILSGMLPVSSYVHHEPSSGEDPFQGNRRQPGE